MKGAVEGHSTRRLLKRFPFDGKRAFLSGGDAPRDLDPDNAYKSGHF